MDEKGESKRVGLKKREKLIEGEREGEGERGNGKRRQKNRNLRRD